jgi:hypothetical protein
MPGPMTKRTSRWAGKRGQRTAKRAARAVPALGPGTVSAREEGRINQGRFEAVMRAAERSGLLSAKSARIAGRVSPALIEQAKTQTGIKGDTDLIAFALASVALKDHFAKTFKKSRGKVPAELKLGF